MTKTPRIAFAILLTASCMGSCTCDEMDPGWDLRDEFPAREDVGPDVVDTFDAPPDVEDTWAPEPVTQPNHEPLEEVQSCTQQIGPEASFHTRSGSGDWTLALPAGVEGYSEVDLAGQPPYAAAGFHHHGEEAAGFVLSRTLQDTELDTESALSEQRDLLEYGIGVIVQDFNGAQFDTHDGHKAAIGRYNLVVDSLQTVGELRQRLLANLRGSTWSTVDGLPSVGSQKFGEFRVFLSVVLRDLGDGTSRMVTSVAAAPTTAVNDDAELAFVLDDLTNTTGLAEANRAGQLQCSVYDAQPVAQADFYWVLDQSGSMTDDYERVLDVANLFYSELNNSNLDYRLGVTTMDVNYHGGLRDVAGWHTDLETFTGEINAVTQWRGNTYEEYGLEAASEGITHMLGEDRNETEPDERVRAGADLITIFMSDEEAQNFQDNPLEGVQGQRMLADFEEFFAPRTTAFAIIGNGLDCGVHRGRAYKRIADVTGGSYASLCAEEISETIQSIIFTATGASSAYVLPHTPITGTLGVAVDGQPVPRSRQNGFDYFPETNSLAFFGSWRPRPPSRVQVSFEMFESR